jgi:hypothetical protein
MGAKPSVKVSVELEAGAEPVSGTVQVEDGPARPFIGWIELARAIERARELADPEKDRKE